MRVVVVGGGSWGSAFARVLANREHDVTLACRDAEQAHTIEETHRNPRYLAHCDLRGVAAMTIDQAPLVALRVRGPTACPEQNRERWT